MTLELEREPPMHISTFRTFRNDRIATWVLRAVQIGALLALASRDSDAQDSTVARRPTNMVGVSIGIAGVANETLPLQLAIVGISATHVQPGHLGFDLSVGTSPYLLAQGATIFGARVGVILPFRVGEQLMLLPGAGISGIGNGDGGALAWNGNLSLLTTVSRGTALRTGISVHQFQGERSHVWLYEMGLAWFIE